MRVKKKNGEIQAFDQAKMINSIMRASDDTHEPLNMGDIDILTRDIMRRLEDSNKEVISSEEVFDTTLLYLMKDRFYHVAEEYRKENNW